MPEEPDLPCCDLVLKGGTTSGVLYPSAVVSLARRFDFVSIGGTSAGALASAATAAAEFRRRHGDTSGYAELAKVPEELAQENFLRTLFTPERSTAKLFRTLERILGGDTPKFRLFLGFVFGRLKRWERAWTANGMGCCTGMALDGFGGRRTARSPRAITPWLCDLIDRLSNVKELTGDPHLTFGHLHGAPLPARLQRLDIPYARSIDARFVTTNVTQGRPVELPFYGRTLGFRPAEWRRIFPASVVDFLVEHARSTSIFDSDPDVVPLPPPEHLPVLVAARMSMALPGVFTTVPLVAVDYESEPPKLRTVRFSDGGITSNLPIHQFDAALPRWPTLAINLQYTKRAGELGRKTAKDMVYLPKQRNEGSNLLWTGVSELGGFGAYGGLRGFFGSMLSSALRWHDNSYLTLPGYKGRVVEVWLDPHEGGNNWDMPPKVVRDLVQRGALAADRLADKVLSDDPAQPFSWNDQKWRRFRSAMAGLEEWLEGFERAAGEDAAGGYDLPMLLDNPPHHRIPPERVQHSLAALEAFSRTCRHGGTGAWRDATQPKPATRIGSRPDLRMAPGGD